MKRLISFIKPFFGIMILSAGLKALATITDLLIPYVMGILIDDGIAKSDVHTIRIMILIMTGIAILGVLLNITAHYTSTIFMQNVSESIRNILVDCKIKLNT